MSQYYYDLRNTEGLTRQEQTILFQQAKQGDLNARDRLIHSVLKLAWNISKNFRKVGVPNEDFVAEASFCVVDNWHKWEPHKSAFTTYIGTCVRNRMGEFLWLKEHNGVYIPRRTIRDLKSTIHLQRSEKREKELKNAKQVLKIALFSSFKKIDVIQRNTNFCIADLDVLLHNLTSTEALILELKAGLSGESLKFSQIAKCLKMPLEEVKIIFNSAKQKVRLNYVCNKEIVKRAV